MLIYLQHVWQIFCDEHYFQELIQLEMLKLVLFSSVLQFFVQLLRELRLCDEDFIFETYFHTSIHPSGRFHVKHRWGSSIVLCLCPLDEGTRRQPTRSRVPRSASGSRANPRASNMGSPRKAVEMRLLLVSTH